MAKMTQEIMDMVNAQDVIKMLGTVDEAKKINVVPIASFAALDAETLMYADIFSGRTRKNLEKSKKATVTVYKPPMAGYQIKGTCTGFQSTGPLWEQVTQKIYQAMKVPCKGVGIIKVEEIYSVSPLSPGKAVV